MDENNQQLERIFQLLDDAQAQILLARQELEQLTGGFISEIVATAVEEVEDTQDSNLVEGVFDGQNMVGPDGKVYTVPANYASKSKLIEGDILKLSIQLDGTFIYKQIAPVERRRVVGILVRDPRTASYRSVADNGRSYKLLTASVTYYKGQANDKVVMLLPVEGETVWAAVENILPPDAVIEDLEYDDTEYFDDEEVDVADADALFTDEPLLESGADAQLPVGGPKITT